MSDQQAKPIGKVRQIASYVQQHYGNDLSTPNAKQIANYNAHMMGGKANEEADYRSEYKYITALLGMYAGYYVMREEDPRNPNFTFTATKLKYGVHKADHLFEGHEIYYGLEHTRWVGGRTLEELLHNICYQIAYNANARSQNVGLWQRRLPAHLRRQPHSSPWRNQNYNWQEIDTSSDQ